MNEPRRLRYLQAMGIDAYVSRGQLPGAAPTRRLAPVGKPQLQPAETETAPAPRSAPTPAMPRLDVISAEPAQTAPPAQAGESVPRSGAAVHFNLACVFAGGVAWVESLDGRPLARDQVKLIHAMARAVHGEAAVPKVAQFDWPMHHNQQFDLGMDAARAALAAFLQRHVEEQKCRALVVLGEAGAELLAGVSPGNLATVTTCSTLDMLESPACKRRVWSDLQPVVLRA